MKARFAGFQVKLPSHPLLRIGLGILLVLFGFLGFLPILGFWMIPLGLVILSVDIPPLRRFYRRMTVRLGGWMHRKFPRQAARFGFGKPRTGKHD